jgi:hypothetical protein
MVDYMKLIKMKISIILWKIKQISQNRSKFNIFEVQSLFPLKLSILLIFNIILPYKNAIIIDKIHVLSIVNLIWHGMIIFYCKYFNWHRNFEVWISIFKNSNLIQFYLEFYCQCLFKTQDSSCSRSDPSRKQTNLMISLSEERYKKTKIVYIFELDLAQQSKLRVSYHLLIS